MNLSRRSLLGVAGTVLTGFTGCLSSDSVEYRHSFRIKPRPVLEDGLATDTTALSYDVRLLTSPADVEPIELETIACKECRHALRTTNFEAGQFWSVVEILVPADWAANTHRVTLTEDGARHVVQLLEGDRTAYQTKLYTLFAGYETDPSLVPDSVTVDRVIEDVSWS